MEELENEVVIPTTEETNEIDNQPTAEEEVNQPQDTFDFKVKYNKEEIALDREKAIEYAQKGMNYDKLNEKLQSYENNKLLKYIQSKGFDPDTLVSQWEQEENEKSIQDYAYRNNVDYGTAQRMHDVESRLAKFEEMQKAELETKQKEEMSIKEFTDLTTWHKDTFGKELVVDEIPKEVLEIKENTGKSFRDSYMEFEFNKLMTKQKEQMKQQENALTSTGSVTANGTNTPITFTPESIEKMTSEEFNKHWDNPAFRKALGMDSLR